MIWDISPFPGQQGYGYNVKELYEEIKRVLGLNEEKKVMVWARAYRQGALISHRMFRTGVLGLIGVFDVAEMPDIAGHRVYPISQLPDFIQEHKPDIDILSVPSPRSFHSGQRINLARHKGVA